MIEAFYAFARERQREEADRLIDAEELNDEAARRYLRTSLRQEFASENGTDLNEALPRLSPLHPDYVTKKQSVFQKIVAFIEKFKGIGGEDLREVSGADERGYIIRSGLDVLLRFCSFRSLCFLGNATVTPLASWYGFLHAEERRGFACEPCTDRTFRLARYRERTFNVLSKSTRNEKDDIFLCRGEGIPRKNA